MMKLAGARDEKHFLEMFPKESDFIKKHGGEMLYMYGGGYYADGGMAPEEAAMMQQQQGQPQEQGGGDQMQQIVQFIGQSLQQGMQPEEIVQKLVEAGLPQDQAMQLVQAVMQEMQGGGQGGAPQEGGMPPQGSPEEMMQAPQGQEAPPEEMMQGQAPMGMYGGSYAYGGAYGNVPQHGQPKGPNNGTYYQGNYFAQGGPFIPEYGDIAWNVDYATGGEAGGGNELVMQVAQLLQQGVQPEAILQQLVKAKVPQKKAVKLIQTVMQKMQAAGGAEQQGGGMMAYGGSYAYGGGYPITQMTTEDPREAARSYQNKMRLYEMNKEMPNYSMNPNTGAIKMLPAKIAMPDSRFGNTTYPSFDLSNPDSKFGERSSPQIMSQMAGRQADAYRQQMFELMQQQERQKQIEGLAEPGEEKFKKRGGSVKYKKGGEYEMSHDDVQKLIKQGYKIQYL